MSKRDLQQIQNILERLGFHEDNLFEDPERTVRQQFDALKTSSEHQVLLQQLEQVWAGRGINDEGAQEAGLQVLRAYEMQLRMPEMMAVAESTRVAESTPPDADHITSEDTADLDALGLRTAGDDNDNEPPEQRDSQSEEPVADPQIEKVQALLTAAGMEAGTVDGFDNDALQSGIARFMSEQGHEWDGQDFSALAQRLQEHVAEMPPQELIHNLQPIMDADSIGRADALTVQYAMQAHDQNLGDFKNNGVDGIVGNYTRAAFGYFVTSNMEITVDLSDIDQMFVEEPQIDLPPPPTATASAFDRQGDVVVDRDILNEGAKAIERAVEHDQSGIDSVTDVPEGGVLFVKNDTAFVAQQNEAGQVEVRQINPETFDQTTVALDGKLIDDIGRRAARQMDRNPDSGALSFEVDNGVHMAVDARSIGQDDNGNPQYALNNFRLDLDRYEGGHSDLETVTVQTEGQTYVVDADDFERAVDRVSDRFGDSARDPYLRLRGDFRELEVSMDSVREGSGGSLSATFGCESVGTTALVKFENGGNVTLPDNMMKSIMETLEQDRDVTMQVTPAATLG